MLRPISGEDRDTTASTRRWRGPGLAGLSSSVTGRRPRIFCSSTIVETTPAKTSRSFASIVSSGATGVWMRPSRSISTRNSPGRLRSPASSTV